MPGGWTQWPGHPRKRCPAALRGLLLFRDLAQLERAKLLRSAEEVKKRQAGAEASQEVMPSTSSTTGFAMK
eukprot:Skav236138  [mRNA]  locus=scaffold88:68027:68239:- [translate_table: standard]